MTEAVRTDRPTGSGVWLAGVLGVIWACAVALVLTVASLAGFSPEGPDEWTYDWRTLFFSQSAERPRDDIAIILIDEDSMRDYDYVSPIDRGLMAKLLQALDSAAPKAVGLDFIYDRRSEDGKTKALIDTIRTMRSPIVYGAIDNRIRGFKPDDLKYQEEFIAKAGRDAGHVFFARQLDQLKIGDQVVRFMGERAPAPPHRKSIAQLLVEKSGATSPSEPASAFIAWLLPPRGGDLFPMFRVPRHRPDAGAETILPESWRQALRGKIVLIGGDFVDRDKHLTPLSVLDGAKMPGVVVQAQILAQLRDGRSIHEVPWEMELALLAVVALLGFLVSSFLSVKRYDWLIYFGGLAALVLLGVVLFSTYAIIIPSTTLFFAWTAGVTGGHYAETVARKLRFARS
jgi:CHASE2 domain-containing sensor protein